MYKSGQGGPGGPGGPPPPTDGTGPAGGGEQKPGDNVVDAEFVDVDDKK
jgi:hypothetical protein